METDRRVARKYLLDTQGHYCAICGATQWNGKPIPLVVDHKDGNPNNGSVLNLRLICPNCDAQLFTFKNRRGLERKSVEFQEGTRASRKRLEYDRKLERNNLTRTIRTRKKTNCLECGSEFVVMHSGQRFCSKTCARKYEISHSTFGSMSRSRTAHSR